MTCSSQNAGCFIRLSHVSLRIRRLSLSIPHLWTYINVKRASRTELRAFLARSMDTGLTVCFTQGLQVSRAQLQYFCKPDQVARWRNLCIMVSPQELRALLQLKLELLTLDTLSLPEDVDNHALPGFYYWNMPSLKTYIGSRFPKHTNRGLKSPCLSTVRAIIDNRRTLWDFQKAHPTHANLVHLALEFRCPWILVDDVTMNSNDIVSLPNLRNLSMVIEYTWPTNNIGRFMTCLDAPRLENLSWSSIEALGLAIVKHRCEFPVFQMIEILHCYPYEDGTIDELLSAYPSLYHLKFANICIDIFAEAIQRDVPTFAKFKTISFHNCEFGRSEDFLALMKSLDIQGTTNQDSGRRLERINVHVDHARLFPIPSVGDPHVIRTLVASQYAPMNVELMVQGDIIKKRVAS